mmetsp:Transcript_22475/g.66624  ORF Transcript_22475/g.66624 Transcript_22475/m.66624 type:complete len:110 (-) Transcript_22475:181-510(-)
MVAFVGQRIELHGLREEKALTGLQEEDFHHSSSSSLLDNSRRQEGGGEVTLEVVVEVTTAIVHTVDLLLTVMDLHGEVRELMIMVFLGTETGIGTEIIKSVTQKDPAPL